MVFFSFFFFLLLIHRSTSFELCNQLRVRRAIQANLRTHHAFTKKKKKEIGEEGSVESTVFVLAYQPNEHTMTRKTPRVQGTTGTNNSCSLTRQSRVWRTVPYLSSVMHCRSDVAREKRERERERERGEEEEEEKKSDDLGKRSQSPGT